MKKPWIFLTIPALVILSSPLLGQTPPGGSPPAPPTKEEDKNSDEKPFKPHWENELGLSHSNQQAGQNTNSLYYTGTFHLDESGAFISGTVDSTRQKVEGVDSTTGSLNLSGGLGIGSFSPSLTVGFQGGESALRLFSGDMAVGIQLWDPFSISLSAGWNIGNHQGNVDLSQLFPNIGVVLAQIDTTGWNSSFGITFVPWDWWTISLTTSNEYDITYQFRSLVNKSEKLQVNETDHIASLTLGLNFTLFKGFVLGISSQGGQEYSPSGTVYSPLAGGLVHFTQPTTQNFAAGTISVTYSFD